MENINLWIQVNVGAMGVICMFLAINAAAALMIVRQKQTDDNEEIRIEIVE